MEETGFMEAALRLGREAMGTTWPNPAVGCVIVKDGEIIGRGATAPAGRPHAETIALAEAGAAARGSTAFVTLEPCAHHGQTPPCAEALIAAGVARVVAPLSDRDPRVDGRGFAKLREAGILVETGLCAEQAAHDHAGFLRVAQNGLPWLTLKLASSFDGRIATSSGESQWITGEPARQFNQTLRAQHDAVMVGAGTARSDNPKLTLRGFGDRRPPVRVVASAALDLPSDSYLAATAREIPLWLIHNGTASDRMCDLWASKGAKLIALPGSGRLDPKAALQALGEAGITRVFCEGGGQWAAALLQAGLPDQVITMIAGMALGGDARPSIGPLGLDRLADAPRFSLRDLHRIGEDVMLVWDKA